MMPLPSDCELNWKKDLLEVPVERVDLEFVAFTAWSQFDALPSKIFLSQVELNVSQCDEIKRALLMRLKACVLGFEAPPIKVCLAATGWDSIKERFFPKWWLKRWPVEYKLYELSVKHLYPFLRPPITTSPVVTILTAKNEPRKYERTD